MDEVYVYTQTVAAAAALVDSIQRNFVHSSWQ